MKKVLLPILFFAMILLTGCGTFEITVETPESFPPVMTDILESTETSTAEPFSYNGLPIGSILTPELAGMVYHDDLGVWIVDGSGQANAS